MVLFYEMAGQAKRSRGAWVSGAGGVASATSTAGVAAGGDSLVVAAGGGLAEAAAPEAEVDTERVLREPPRYAVLLLNDDYTTMEFVVEVLTRYFAKNTEEAVEITLKVHREGRGVAGIYSQEIAETKAAQVMELARSRQFPLQTRIERVDD
jgi:ATP-dependent Clp protease adaptor protein ClpS